VDCERIVRDLAAALPEAFEGRDLVEDYYSDWGEPDQRWLAYIAVADARMWIEEHAGRAQEHLAWCNDAVGHWPA
jgi:hypothetical protein